MSTAALLALPQTGKDPKGPELRTGQSRAMAYGSESEGARSTQHGSPPKASRQAKEARYKS